MSKLILSENDVSPETPAAGKVAVYARDNSSLYYKASDGVEHPLGGGGSDVTYPITVDKGGTGQETRQAAIDGLTAVANPGVETHWVLKKNPAGNAVFGAVVVPGVTNGSGSYTVPDYSGTENRTAISPTTAYGAAVQALSTTGTYTDPDTAIQSPFSGGTVVIDPYVNTVDKPSPFAKFTITNDLKNILDAEGVNTVKTYSSSALLLSDYLYHTFDVEQTATNTNSMYEIHVEDIQAILEGAREDGATTESKYTLRGPSDVGMFVEGTYGVEGLEDSTVVVGNVAQGNNSQAVILKVTKDLTANPGVEWGGLFGNASASVSVEPVNGTYMVKLKGDAVLTTAGISSAGIGGTLKVLTARTTTTLPNGTGMVDVADGLAPFGAGFLKAGRTIRMKITGTRGANQSAFQLVVLCAGVPNPIVAVNLPGTNAPTSNVVALDVVVQVHSDGGNFLLDATATGSVDGTFTAVFNSNSVATLPNAGIKLAVAHNPNDAQAAFTLASYVVEYQG